VVNGFKKIARWNETLTLIGRCKGCRKGIRVEAVPGTVPEVDPRFGSRRNALKFGEAVELALHGCHWSGCFTVCAGCGERFQLRRLLGKVVADKACGGRCMSATGPSCECACGGANHGANHA